MKENKYLIAVDNLFKAIDIAVNLPDKYPPIKLGDDFLDFCKESQLCKEFLWKAPQMSPDFAEFLYI